jgi:hypothetical protein
MVQAFAIDFIVHSALDMVAMMLKSDGYYHLLH